MADVLAPLVTLFNSGRTAEVEAALRELVHANPADPDGHNNLGGVLLRRGELAEAAACYRRAMALQPSHPAARLNLARTLIAIGDPEGWALYDERPERRSSEAHKLGFPEWRGEPLAGKRLFIWPEQGFGDQILAARFFARTGAAEVTAACHPALTRLFAQLPIRVIERTAQTAVMPHDFWALPLSLPRWCEAPWQEPYLQATARPRGRVGVAWRGNAQPDPARSMPDPMAAALLAIPGAFSLLPEDTGARDFQETAEIVAGLDLVLTIDTSIAHLAGAMGKHVLLMLHHHSHDWRWERPWYPHVRTFRQASPRDWASVISAVVGAASSSAAL